MNASDLSRAVSILTAPLKRRVRLMLSKAVLKLIDDDKKCQQVQAQLYADELHDDVERFQEYGFSSVPDKDAEAIAASMGGERSHMVIIATEDRRYRPKGQKRGEVVLYTLQNGVRILLKEDGNILLGTDPTEFVALANLVMARLNTLQSALDAHKHSGVTTGLGTSGVSDSPVGALADVAATEVKAK